MLPIMPTLIAQPTRIESAGNKPKIIEEFVGQVNTSTAGVSVARMRSPEGWEEPGQTPEFDEYTVVLQGTLRVHHKSGELDVAAGQVRSTSPFDCRHFPRMRCIATSRTQLKRCPHSFTIFGRFRLLAMRP